MTYDQELARRVRRLLEGRPGYEEKKMFGGIGFLINGTVACGVLREELIVRTGTPEYACAVHLPHVRQFDFTCGPMPDWVMVGPGGTRTDEELAAWVESGVCFARTPPRPRE